MEWQKNEIRKIYDNAHRTRRAIISVGRARPSRWPGGDPEFAAIFGGVVA
jgi:hypothetical protein